MAPALPHSRLCTLYHFVSLFCVGLWGGVSHCVHGSSPQLTLGTLKILDVSCLQLYFSHLLPLTRTFFPSNSLVTFSWQNWHCAMPTDSWQFISIRRASCNSTVRIKKKKSSSAYTILLFLVLKKLLYWYSTSNLDDRNLHFKERQVEISHQLNKLSYASGYVLQYLFRITPTPLNIQKTRQMIVLSATS